MQILRICGGISGGKLELHDTKRTMAGRSSDGVLRKARNPCLGFLVQAVRSAEKTVDLANVNCVLLQPHWQNEIHLSPL